MSKEKQIEEMAELICDNYTNGKCATDGFICNHNCEYKDRAERLYNAGYRKQSENATLEAVDKFRSELINKFIDLCRGNDYNKINLLLIGETIDQIFDDVVAKMKGGAE